MFQIAEISRVRGAVTTGNVVDILGRAVCKLEYLEKRSHNFNGYFADFWLHLDQEVVQVRWMDHNCGFDALKSIIEQFVYIKFTKIAPHVLDNLSEQISAFKQKLKDTFAAARREIDPQSEYYHDEFLQQCQTVKIDDIFHHSAQFNDRCVFMWKV